MQELVNQLKARLMDIRALRLITISELAREIGIGHMTLYNMLTDKNIPRLPTLRKIRDYLQMIDAK